MVSKKNTSTTKASIHRIRRLLILLGIIRKHNNINLKSYLIYENSSKRN